MDQKTKESEIDLLRAQPSTEKGPSLAERLEVENKAKDGEALRTARKWLQTCLLILLSFEVLFIAYVMLSQGAKILLFSSLPFGLNEWAFGLFVNVALVQTCVLIMPIAQSLFPVNHPKP
jgi:hypothetical protein